MTPCWRAPRTPHCGARALWRLRCATAAWLLWRHAVLPCMATRDNLTRRAATTSPPSTLPRHRLPPPFQHLPSAHYRAARARRAIDAHSRARAALSCHAPPSLYGADIAGVPAAAFSCVAPYFTLYGTGWLGSWDKPRLAPHAARHTGYACALLSTACRVPLHRCCLLLRTTLLFTNSHASTSLSLAIARRLRSRAAASVPPPTIPSHQFAAFAAAGYLPAAAAILHCLRCLCAALLRATGVLYKTQQLLRNRALSFALRWRWGLVGWVGLTPLLRTLSRAFPLVLL